jgi:glycosyltransferase involved in cell wall biosynthesis
VLHHVRSSASLYVTMNQSLRIVIISRGDAASGGAGRVAEELSEALRSELHRVDHFIRRPARAAYQTQSTLLRGIKGDVLLRNLVAVDPSGLQLLARPEVWRADVVHFHDFALAYGANVARVIARRKPTVFSLHDFSGLSGGCLTPRDCRRYEVGCGDCPQIGQWPLQLPLDLTSRHWQIHHEIASTTDARAIAPSRYVRRAALRGPWPAAKVDTIPNAVDTAAFSPALRAEGRRTLGLGTRATALLFVAVDPLAPDKGFADLEEAFLRLAVERDDLYLVIVGDLDAVPERLEPYSDRVRICGLIEDTSRLARVYAACDCYTTTSRAETFHLAMIEAMACGTPVVAYPAGGVEENLRNAPAAWMVDTSEPTGLADELRRRLPAAKLAETRRRARRFAVDHFSMDVFCSRHLDVYHQLIKEAAPLEQPSSP